LADNLGKFVYEVETIPVKELIGWFKYLKQKQDDPEPAPATPEQIMAAFG